MTEKNQEIQKADRWNNRGNRILRMLRPSVLFAKIRQFGMGGILRKLYKEARGFVCMVASRRWDRRNGVDTSGQVALADLEVVGSNRVFGHWAISTSPRTFQYFSRYFPSNLDQFTFIDMGCGKGRTLLMASTMGFRRIIGIEFAPALCEIARANLVSYRGARGQGVMGDIVEADITEYPLPREKMVLYFNNPFFPELWPRMIASIVRSLRESPREIHIILTGSALPGAIHFVGDKFAATGLFQRVGSGIAPYFIDTYLPYHYEVFKSLGG